MLVLGVLLVVVYFALAPRSPVYSNAPTSIQGFPSRLDDLAGVLALVLVLAGYVVREFETKPKPVAMHSVLYIITLLLWVVAAIWLYELRFQGQGLTGLLLSILMLSPIIVALHHLIRRRVKKYVLRPIVVVGEN